MRRWQEFPAWASWPLSILGFVALVAAYNWMTAGSTEREVAQGAEAALAQVEARAARMQNGSSVKDVFPRCRDDCSGHRAGYMWAFENRVEDPVRCRNHSASFTEGCETGAADFRAGKSAIASLDRADERRGMRWAKRHGIDNPDDCPRSTDGNGNAWWLGCVEAAGEEAQRRAK